MHPASDQSPAEAAAARWHAGIGLFLLIVLAGGVCRAEPDTEPKDQAITASGPLDESDIGVGSWIWTGESFDKQTCRFWRAIDVPDAPVVRYARLRITADNGFRVFFDGRQLGRGSDWRWISEYDLTWLMSPGRHVLAVDVFNDALEGGLLAGLRLELADDSIVEIRSDDTWYVVPDSDKGWAHARRPRDSWMPAVVVGAMGSPPWHTGNRGVIHVPPVRPITLHFWQQIWFQITLVSFSIVTLGICLWLLAKLVLQSRAQNVLQLERARIARDIHDDVGAGLTQLVLQGEVAQMEFAEGSSAREQFAQMCEKARAVSHSLEEVVWAVNSRRDTVRDFTSYACKYAQTFFNASPVRCRLDVEPEIPVSKLELPVRRGLFLAVKEALNNVARHSGASEVHLRIHRETGSLVVVVEDNGKGFAVNSVSGDGNGIENMKERLRDIGGSVRWESRAGNGCRVEFRVPLAAGNLSRSARRTTPIEPVNVLRPAASMASTASATSSTHS